MSALPCVVPGLDNVVKASAGGYHSLAISCIFLLLSYQTIENKP